MSLDIPFYKTIPDCVPIEPELQLLHPNGRAQRPLSSRCPTGATIPPLRQKRQ